LSLKTLCGLSAAEIAGALLTSEETISKRIYRAREKLKAENIQLEMPPPSQLPARLDTVLQMLYLLFNEGYLSSHSSHIIREELCEEAMRLTYQLTLHARTALPQTFALLALFCFQASRLKARVDDRGAIVLLQQQDRSLWYRPLIEKGSELLDVATASGGSSAYHFEAAIAAIHASAPSFAQTDWTSIYRLYQLLYAIRPGAIVSMNMAVAAAYAGYPQEGLQQLLATGGLEHHHLYHACLGELYATLQDKEKAGAHLHHALRLAPSLTEQALLRRKLEAL
jgi:RNA polymerase sigma-70 factor (ECF subfamily)